MHQYKEHMRGGRQYNVAAGPNRSTHDHAFLVTPNRYCQDKGPCVATVCSTHSNEPPDVTIHRRFAMLPSVELG